MRVGIVGCGAVGARAARQLLATDAVTELAIAGHRRDQAEILAHSLGTRARVVRDVRDVAVDGLVLASPAGTHFALARDAIAAGRFVVSASDALDDVRLLSTLAADAAAAGVAVVLGAGFAPGLTCVLARLGARHFDTVEEIHVAKAGTGGPACAREHHRAFRGVGLEWRDGAWAQRRGGSGRELCWFPEPVGGRDCYRAALADPVLLLDAFPTAVRVTARVAATRRDRLTMHLPMLRPPHADGGVGAVRVELRGQRAGGHHQVVYGAIDRPAVAAGAVAAQVCQWIFDGRLARHGAFGLAEVVEAGPFLQGLATRGVKAAIFDGTPRRHPLPSPLGG